MINDTLVFLKNSLNAHFNRGGKPNEPREDQVVFPVGQASDSISLKLGAVSLLLINVEQENILHAPNLYRRTMPDGTVQNVNPEIRLNLLVLFVANYQQYEDALRYLSGVIQYFQNHRLITQRESPELNDDIEQLVIELETLPFSEQNEVWGSLRIPYRPSVLYRIKTLVYEGEPQPTMPIVEEKDFRIEQ